MNIGHCFQFRVNYGWGDLIGENDLTTDLYPSVVNYNSMFQVYAIVYFVINFFVFILVNGWIEVCLVLKMRNEIGEKKAKLEEEIRVSQVNNSSGSDVINKVVRSKRRKIKQDANKETRAIVMVVSNSLINFFFRLPEILVFVASNNNLIKMIIYETSILSYSSNIESLILGVSFVSYILTFTTNVATFYLFNHKFKQLLIYWTSYVKQK
jgi:hypothetical protein